MSDTGLFGWTCGPRHRGKRAVRRRQMYALFAHTAEVLKWSAPVIGLTGHMVNINVSKQERKRKEDINATGPDWLAVPLTNWIQRLPSLTEWPLLSIYPDCIFETESIQAGCSCFLLKGIYFVISFLFCLRGVVYVSLFRVLNMMSGTTAAASCSCAHL